MARAIVFDLGGTNLRCGFAVENGRVELDQRIRIQNYLQGSSVAEVWRGIVDHVTAYIDTLDAEPDTPIVCSFPGPIIRRRTVLAAPTLFGPGGPFPDLAVDLERATGRRVSFLNDVSAAAWYLSTQTGARRFFVVTVSSGIGSKLFDRDHPLGVIDDPPFAGEIGHTVVDYGPDAPPCDCGGIGHLGAVASGRGIERRARLLAERFPAQLGKSAFLGEHGIPSMLTNEEHLIPAARAGDSWTLALIRQCTAPLARTLSAVAIAAGIEKIFLIGGFAQSLGNIYLEIITDLFNRDCGQAAFAGKSPTLISIMPERDEVCLAGAAVFAQRLEPCR